MQEKVAKKEKSKYSKKMADEEKKDEETIVSEEEELSSEKASRALKKVKEALKKCEKEKKEYLDGWKRAKADAVNEKKRQATLLDAERRNALGHYVLAVLPIVDSIRAAISQAEDTVQVAGIRRIETQCMKAFSDMGVDLIDPAGKLFDPHQHQSVGEKPVQEKKKDSKVLEVLQVGAKINETVIRAAMVYVGKYEDKRR